MTTRKYCGTNRGYYNHLHVREQACDLCKNAHNKYTTMKARELREKKREERNKTSCGTDRGYYRHRRLGEPTCEPCKNAHTKVERARYKERTGIERERRAPFRPNINQRKGMLTMDKVMFASVYFSLPPDVQQVLDEHFEPDRISRFVGDLTGEELMWRHKLTMENREREREKRERRRAAGAT